MPYAFILSLVIIIFSTACNLSTEQAQPTVSVDVSTQIPTAVTIQPTATTAPTSTPIPSNSSPITSSNTSTTNTTSSTSNCSKQTNLGTYTVVAGDTLFGIAQRGNTTVAILTRANCISDAGVISVGQVLYVPNPITAKTPPLNPTIDPNRYTVETIWIVQGGGASGYPVGCGDSALLQQSGVPANLTVEETFNRAWTYMVKQAGPGAGRADRGFWNPLSETTLTIQGLNINGEASTVYFNGQIQLIGTCADAQLQSQIALNVLFLTRTKVATIFINGENMRKVFDESGITTKTSYSLDDFINGTVGNDNNGGRQVIEYYAASDGNYSDRTIPVGCDGWLAPIDTDTFATGDTARDVNMALTALFDPNRFNPSSAYDNLLKDKNLFVRSVTINNGQANIEIGNQLMGIGTCADALMEAQIVRTVFQFADINSAKIIIGDQNLHQLTDGKGDITIDYVYPRPT